MPCDWPTKSFFNDVPKKNQMFVIAVVISVLLLPLIVSCITYTLVYFSVIVKGEQGYMNSSSCHSSMPANAEVPGSNLGKEYNS